MRAEVHISYCDSEREIFRQHPQDAVARGRVMATGIVAWQPIRYSKRANVRRRHSQTQST